MEEKTKRIIGSGFTRERRAGARPFSGANSFVGAGRCWLCLPDIIIGPGCFGQARRAIDRGPTRQEHVCAASPRRRRRHPATVFSLGRHLLSPAVTCLHLLSLEFIHRPRPDLDPDP